jgi:DNA-binding GntR family transcriptional regulator
MGKKSDMDQKSDLAGFEGEDFFPDGVKRTSRAEGIAEVVREGIDRGYWKPEDRINDQELSERLGVSRLTVREALSRLVERRILEKKHWKGYTVRKFTWEEIDNLIDVRLSLEELALRKAVEKNPEQTVSEMSAALEASKKIVADGDFQGFFNTDFLFHEIMYRRSGNPWIEDILSDLHLVIILIRHLSQAEHVEDVARRSIQDHERIMDALRQGQWDGAVDALRQHLNNHRNRVRREYGIHGGSPGSSEA